MTKIQNFIECLKGNSFDIHYSSTETSTTVLENIDGLQLEFLLNYSCSTENYIAATHDQPEECDFVFIPESHEEIALYDAEGMIELSNEEVHQIDLIISESVY